MELEFESVRRVAFIGNHTPRRCGLATFTADLAQAVAGHGIEVAVVAMDDSPGEYAYPRPVSYQIDQNDRLAYRKAADALDHHGYDVACLQHEYGIFGGEAGEFVLELLRNLNMPIVTTLHTVLAEPSSAQRRVLEEILQLSERVAVMSQRGKKILIETHQVDPDKVDFIPHGAPPASNGPTEPHKARLGFAGRDLVFTFGLLGPDKGIEYMVEALPQIVEGRPNVLYVVLGATHPHVRARHGEAYRESLLKRAEELGVSNHLTLLDRYASLEELLEFLCAADVYVTPYLKREQITSGTLTYAVASGKPVVSTPYWHAEELLANGIGTLVPFRDASALAGAIGDLLDNPDLRRQKAEAALRLGDKMRWSEVGRQYIECFARARAESSTRLRSIVHLEPRTAPTASSPLRISLQRICELTDDVGILQHATYTIPYRAEGYCTDDNARALILCAMLEGSPEHFDTVTRLGSRYMAFLHHAFNPQYSRFRNFMGYDRVWREAVGSEDCHGRALWALGAVIGRSRNHGWRGLSMRLFHEALPAATRLQSARAWAFSILGIAEYLKNKPEDEHARNALRQIGQRLRSALRAEADDTWRWFEPVLAYDDARLPHALLVAGRCLSLEGWVEEGLLALEWLSEAQTGPNGVFLPIGSQRVWRKGEERSTFDQQPLEAWASMDAFLAAWRATGNARWRSRAENAFAWFFGRNTEGIAVADPETGSCHDGLQRGSLNENRGAESTLAFVIASTLAVTEGIAAPAEAARPYYA